MVGNSNDNLKKKIQKCKPLCNLRFKIELLKKIICSYEKVYIVFKVKYLY